MHAVAPRPSLGAEAARAAVLQAEFNEKRWVWVPDEKEGYLAGWVLREDDDLGEIMLATGGETRTVPLYSLSKMNPPKFDRVDDIADLTFLNEASVVHNLRLRYGSGAIYTYSGLFLVAINPYTNLPLYSESVVQQYRNKRKEENPPHIFAVAENAWISMGEVRENQSILITGESGAGKTENTKKVIQYLAAIAAEQANLSSSPSSNSVGVTNSLSGIPRSAPFKSRHRSNTLSQAIVKSPALGLMERQILQANPILEAFGNAQTQRNNNSSRFGKFVRISFSGDGTIAGANIDWYLLEKSRVTFRSVGERSFHVFYQLLEGGGALKSPLLLDGNIEDYNYLNKSRSHVDGIDDREEWRALKTALDVVGFSPEEQFDLFRVAAAILHIGNIDVTSDRSDQAHIPVPSQVEKACHLLGLPVPEFTKAVLRPRVLAGREWVTQARTKQQASDELSSLCKTIYEKSFGAMVDRINKALDRPVPQIYIHWSARHRWIRDFHTILQSSYHRLGVQNFGLDLQPTIDLIESREPIGILSCLDEECIMPRATDATFTEKLHSLWTLSASSTSDQTPPHPGMSKYTPSRLTKGFVIIHYAGKVEYDTEGWLEKNKDPLNSNLTRVMASSSERYISQLFAEYGDNGDIGVVKKRVKKGAFRTVGQRHKEQLSSLMTQLKATQPHFVRCIVPNPLKRPGRVDIPLILDQLRCNGVLEGIRIARLGYPNRLPFAEFRQRYETLTPGILPPGYMDGRKACTRMVEALDLDSSSYAIGNSKVFFKAGVLAELEERRDALLFDIFSRLQAVGRMYTARRQMKKILNRAVAVRTIQRNARVYGELREWPWWQLYTKVRPLLAATRNDEELRKKELELALVKERAERDQREKAALEALKMQLEQEKRKIEDELEAEREFALDKDRILERSKKREARLEEEVAVLQADLETLDSQLERAMAAQKAGEEKYVALKTAFDHAADHLVRLETAEKQWAEQEKALFGEKTEKEHEWEATRARCNVLEREGDELRRTLVEKDEDLVRFKKRTDATIAELETKLTVEVKNRDVNASRSDQLEREARQAREQLADLARTATDYESIVQKKENELARLGSQILASHRDRDTALTHVTELQGHLDTLKDEVQAQELDRERGAQARAKLEAEIDELRTLLNAKASEDTRRSEAEKSQEQELSDLRARVAKAQLDLVDERRLAVEVQSKLKVDLETLQREHNSTVGINHDLQTRAKENEKGKIEAEQALQAVEKSKRAAEADLHTLRSKQLDLEGQLAETLKAKEALDRQLASAQAKHQDFEDAVLQIEREKASWVRQMESVRKQVEAETSRRTQVEQGAKLQHREATQLKEQFAKLELEHKKTLDDLHQRDWEVSQLRSKQDKTIVEHVHVLEEAKRVTDRQLALAQQELKDLTAYVKSLEKAKTRLIGDAEDLTRQTERERLELKAKEKAAKAHEQLALRAKDDVENERKAREAAELRTRRAESELKNMQSQLADTQRQLETSKRSKAQLESELASLVNDGDTPNSADKIRRQYEAKITQLEQNNANAGHTRSNADRIRQHVEQQQIQLRRLIMTQMPKDDSFRTRLLRELEEFDKRLLQEFSHRPSTPVSEIRTLANVSPSKRTSMNGVARPRLSSLGENSHLVEAELSGLRQQIQTLEIQIVASDRVRQHLQAVLRDITADLDHTDGTKQSLQTHRAKLAQENARLKELLDEEADTRRANESAQLDGVKALWTKFQHTISQEQASYAKLEDSRKALLAQQRAAQTELEDHRRQVTELLQSKQHLQTTVADLKDRLEREFIAKNEETAAKLQLQAQLQEIEASSAASSTVNSEFKEAVETYKAKAEAYLGRLEAAEIAKAKAMRAETFARKSLQEAEKAMTEVIGERKACEEGLRSAEAHIRSLEARLEKEMEEERDQHQKDLAERDFTIDQTRKKYQTELAQLSEELQSQRETMSRLREENRKTRGDLDNLQLQYDDEVYSGNAWKKEKERLESKIADLTGAYDSATTVQSEQQSQIVNLLSQVRELRGVLDDAEADRTALQQARRNLEARLSDIAQGHHADSEKLSSDRVLQALHLEKQDLRSSLDEQRDRVALASERLKKAEAHALDCQNQLNQIRKENSDLDRRNAELDKQVKELNLRIVDQETKSYAASPRPSSQNRRLEVRVEELTAKLNQELKEKAESGRAHRNADKSIREAQFQLAENERIRLRLEAEVKTYEAKVTKMRSAMDELQTSEGDLQLAKRRAERDAAEQKQRTLALEREVERLRIRLERPSTAMLSSPISSPRK
ncbi:hypothetical protein BS47DRAFT_1337113 [Hydnum rufescens UP504]|uniref:Nonmuscle myosin heavy chain b n=1 Tax=Hydnum rufescens UP504 TaxID=1448309 RepID=A0A9P6E1I7_9AGAM|nr:hypothetical protein BS47DRAFT_1337113 [Hydnum rufescens UP504]